MKLPASYKKPLPIACAVVLVTAAFVNHARERWEAWGFSQTSPSAQVPANLPFSPKEAGPPELALVAPLKKGGQLLDYEITAINGVEKGVIDVVLTKGTSSVILTIALASDAGPLAPSAAGPYALFSSRRGAPADDANNLTGALLQIVKTNASAAVPPGLSAYQMEPPPPAPPPK